MSRKNVLPLPIIWDDNLEPHNPLGRDPWPTKFKTRRGDGSMPYDVGPHQVYNFDMAVWEPGVSENDLVAAYGAMIEYHCPKGYAVYRGDRFTFQNLESKITIDNKGSGSRETFTSAVSRYTNARTDALSRLGQNPNPSFHTSQVSDLGSEEAYLPLRSTGTTVAGKHLLARLLATPLWPDLFISGQVFNQLPPPSRKYRSTLSGEVKPPTRSIRRYIAYTMQILKYAIIGRDMHGMIHALLMVGMSFRRIVCDRNSDDIYVDIGTPTNGKDIEVQEMTLEELLWYGHFAFDGENSRPSAITGPPDSLFYRFIQPSRWSPRPQSDIDARHAFISFLDHMGQSHFDILQEVNETAQSPLHGLTGKWARVKNVTLEQLGWAAVGIHSRWSDLPCASSTARDRPDEDDNGADEDGRSDTGHDDRDQSQGEDADKREYGDRSGQEVQHNPSPPRSPSVVQLTEITTGPITLDDQSDDQYGQEVCWDALGFTAFTEERRRWREEMWARFEPFRRC